MSGLCECGCGEAVRSRYARGHHMRGRKKTPEHVANVAAANRGQKRPQIAGENNPAWKGDEAGVVPKHLWLNRHYPRTGICEECGKSGERTEYAFKHHPDPHTRNRDDYRELCTSCHKKFDGLVGRAGWRR